MQRATLEIEHLSQLEIEKNIQCKNALNYGLSLVQPINEHAPSLNKLISRLQSHFTSQYGTSFSQQQNPHATISAILMPRKNSKLYKEDFLIPEGLAQKLDHYPDKLADLKRLKHQNNNTTMYRALNSVNSTLKHDVNLELVKLKITSNGNVVLILSSENCHKLRKLRNKLRIAGAEQKYTSVDLQDNIYIVVGYFNTKTNIHSTEELKQIIEAHQEARFQLNHFQLVEYRKTTQENGFSKNLKLFTSLAKDENIEQEQSKPCSTI